MRRPFSFVIGLLSSSVALSACGATESEGDAPPEEGSGGWFGTGGAFGSTGGAVVGPSMGGAGTSGPFGTGGIIGAGGSFSNGGAPFSSGGSIGSSSGGTGAGGDTSAGGTTTAGGSFGSGGDVSTGGTLGSGGDVSTGGVSSTGGTPGTGGSTGSCTTPPAPSPLVGWASVEDGGTRTTGGEGGPTTTVTTLSELTAAVKGTNAQVIQIRGTISGDVTIGSNKTLVGLCGATIRGYVSLNRSVNVIVRNLNIVGKNCTDSSDCQNGDDAVGIQGAAHHLWFDHDDISDGTDGNLDITHASDFITISWTKFHYSGRRSGGHQFSNLIGHSDDNAGEDTGHLRVTFHHTWWADNAVERMPRVRFGRVHVFNSLYTASGNNYCIGVGDHSNIRSENNVFIGVQNPIKDYASDSANAGLIRSSGNDYSRASGSKDDIGIGSVFTPGYSVSLDPTSSVEAAVRAGAGPQ
jgi:pectate lyase